VEARTGGAADETGPLVGAGRMKVLGCAEEGLSWAEKRLREPSTVFLLFFCILFSLTFPFRFSNSNLNSIVTVNLNSF
jgi:hypothetical protein